MLPKFAAAYALKDIKDLRDIYLKTAKVTLAISTISRFINCLGKAFIILWVGKEGFAGSPVLLLLIAMNVLHALGSPAITLLQGIGKNKWVTYSEIGNAI